MLSLVLASASILSTVCATNGKRGIIGVDNIHSLEDQKTLLAGNASTWAYNYGTQPGNATWFGDLEFVPQLWGGDAASTFEADVLANVPATKHIFAFNEPDGSGSGQATMTPALAATVWKTYVEPLRKHNITLGSPSCTGTDSGIQWLKEFYGNCTTCHIDFITTHWYGDYLGLAAHIGNMYAVFNGTPIWITEMGIADVSLEDTESMFNSSVNWLDGLSWVDRYAWFGDFRSSDSNIGPNVTMLNASGNLTGIGEDYLYQSSNNLTVTYTPTTSSGSNNGADDQSSSSSSSVSGAHAAAATVTATSSTSGSGKLGDVKCWMVAGVSMFAALVAVA